MGAKGSSFRTDVGSSSNGISGPEENGVASSEPGDAQLDLLKKFVIPTGLYPSCAWDIKAIRHMVMGGKVAPLFPGQDERMVESLRHQHAELPHLEEWEECPICFLLYPGGLNRSNCCRKGLCTECLLQIKRPSLPVNCPFCNRANFATKFSGVLPARERQREREEEQMVIELKIRMRNEEVRRDRERQDRTSTSSQSVLQQQRPSSFLRIPATAPLDLGFVEEFLIDEALRLSLHNDFTVPSEFLPGTTTSHTSGTDVLVAEVERLIDTQQLQSQVQVTDLCPTHVPTPSVSIDQSVESPETDDDLMLAIAMSLLQKDSSPTSWDTTSESVTTSETPL